MMSRLENILSRLEKVSRAGKGFKACCPAHPDRSPSLSVKESDSGQILVHCFAGCTTDSVMAALGLTLADLYEPKLNGGQSRKRDGINRRELKAAVDFERQVLFIVNADKKAGRLISQVDLERATLAINRISSVSRIL